MFHNERDAYKLQLYSAFIYGLRFDVSIYRGRKISIAQQPAYAEWIRHLLELKEEYNRFFYHGLFVSKCEPKLPKGVRCADYLYDNEHMSAFINMNKKAIELEYCGKHISIGANDVCCVLIE